MARIRHGTIAALDIGTTKVCCFIAHTDEDDRLHLRGFGHQVSKGMRGGTIIDMDAVERSVLAAVHAAEQMAGEQIHGVVVNISCGYPASRTIGLEIAIGGHEVSETDIYRALDRGREYQIDSDRSIVHSIPIGYTIDNSQGIRDPRGMYGDRLGVDIHLVTAGVSAVRNIRTCIDRTHLSVDAMVISPYASALACLVDDETQLGVTLIDMGGGTTTIAVFYEGEVVFTDFIPVGGIHVTNDIAHGLSTPVVHAERMKTLYGSAIASPADQHEVIDVPPIGESDHAEPNHVPKSLLTGVIQPRIEEIFELVRSRLELSGFGKVAGNRVVLTGGTSQLSGVRDLAALILDKQIRMGRPTRLNGLADASSGPAFSTCAGLLNYGVEKHVAPTAWAGLNPEEPNGLMGRLGEWIRVNF
ncbi:MAG: cell division protein FtsA [Alphaproteobacteria bacterium]|nr:cell division protein FtsA [Alphaproteobacteria bacterium]